MNKLKAVIFSLTGITIILFSSLLYIGCEGNDDNVDDYFDNNPYQETPGRDNTAPRPPSTNTPPSSVPLSIHPGTASAKPGQQIGFNADGGTAPYRWSVGIPAHGNVTPQSNSKYAIYTHLGDENDINNVIVKDAKGAVAVADIN